jgi:hypothetical protein
LREVSTAAELQAAVESPNVREIFVSAELKVLRTLRLSPGQTLAGTGTECALHFAAGSDGLQPLTIASSASRSSSIPAGARSTTTRVLNCWGGSSCAT